MTIHLVVSTKLEGVLLFLLDSFGTGDYMKSKPGAFVVSSFLTGEFFYYYRSSGSNLQIVVSQSGAFGLYLHLLCLILLLCL